MNFESDGQPAEHCTFIIKYTTLPVGILVVTVEKR